MSEKYKKAYNYLNYAEHLLILASTVTDCVSIPAFASLVSVPVGIMGSAVGLKFVQSLQELKIISQLSRKRRKSMIKYLLGKSKLDTMEIDSYISHDYFCVIC